MQRYTVYFYLETALHVSGGTTTHHQERKQMYLQHLVFVTRLLLPAATAAGSSNVWQIPHAVDTVVCAPDDGWWYHPKHVEQFPDKNKLCNVASCWIYIRIFLRCTDPWTLKRDWTSVCNAIYSAYWMKPYFLSSFSFYILILWHWIKGGFNCWTRN